MGTGKVTDSEKAERRKLTLWIISMGLLAASLISWGYVAVNYPENKTAYNFAVYSCYGFAALSLILLLAFKTGRAVAITFCVLFSVKLFVFLLQRTNLGIPSWVFVAIVVAILGVFLWYVIWGYIKTRKSTFLNLNDSSDE